MNDYRFRKSSLLLPLLFHALLIGSLLFVSEKAPDPVQKPLVRVQTVRLERPIIKEEPSPPVFLAVQEAVTIEEPPPPVVEQPAPPPTPVEQPAPEKPVPAPPKKPVQEKAKTKKATPKKEKPKAKKSASPPKAKSPKPAMPTSPSPEETTAVAALEILQKLESGPPKGVKSQPVKGTIRAPSPLSSLKIDSLVTFDNSETVSLWQSSYQDELAQLLEHHLVLPEQGQVVITLLLASDGAVKESRVKRSENERNSHYVKEKLSRLKFPGFGKAFTGEKEHEFTITLRNKL